MVNAHRADSVGVTRSSTPKAARIAPRLAVELVRTIVPFSREGAVVVMM
jgi:hypothetical protein